MVIFANDCCVDWFHVERMIMNRRYMKKDDKKTFIFKIVL